MFCKNMNYLNSVQINNNYKCGKTKQRLKRERKTEKTSANQAHLYESMQKIAASMDETSNQEPLYEKPSIENDFLKPKTTDHSRYMPH